MNKDCVSLEIAQKLQKAGWRGECGYYWLVVLDNFNVSPELKEGKRTEGKSGVYNANEGKWEEVVYPAPTATQLAEELPVELKKGGWENWNNRKDIYFSGVEKKWVVEYIAGDLMGAGAKSATLPDALGLMRVYLLENKLI